MAKKQVINPDYARFFQLIEKYETIVVFRHIIPDYDALGSQFGLVSYLKEHYPTKKIYALGDNHVKFSKTLFPVTDEVDDLTLTDNPFLAIILDTSEQRRIADNRHSLAKQTIVVDHHLTSQEFGDLRIVENDKVAAAEILANILFAGKHPLSATTGKYLFTGIVGDSGRFVYHNTTGNTFRLAGKLIDTGFDIRNDVYLPMYNRTMNDIANQGYILSHFTVTTHGVAYYILDKKTLEELKILPSSGKEHVNLFSGIEGIKIWVSCSEDYGDLEQGDGSCGVFYRVSIRSSSVKVNEVAQRHGGGGHAYASATRCIYNLDQFQELIADLDQLCK